MERKRIGEILADLEVLRPEDIDRVLTALRRRGGRGKFGQVAREMGLVREEHILAALAVQLELIPRAGDLSLARLLDQLAAPPVPVSSRRR
jgi:hypothetical protein